MVGAEDIENTPFKYEDFIEKNNYSKLTLENYEYSQTIEYSIEKNNYIIFVDKYFQKLEKNLEGFSNEKEDFSVKLQSGFNL
jgi:hypothetical protein